MSGDDQGGIRETHSPCPECGRVLPASLVHRAGGVVLVRRCPEHGEQAVPYRRDARLYEEVSRLAGAVPYEPSLTPSCRVDPRKTRIIGIDLTERCNLDCPVCFTDANPPSPPPEVSRGAIVEALSRVPVGGIEVTLLGGEPTLRPDLPEIIADISALGFPVKLITNGLRLRDPAAVRRLKEAGLAWTIVQFDGFSDEIYLKLRGERLLEQKIEALDAIAAAGIQICLAVMLVEGVNTGQIGKILRFAFERPAVKHVALLPASPLGRDGLGLGDRHLFPEDVIDLIDEQSGGRIRRRDFLATMRLLRRLHRLTRHVDFRQRVCFYPMPLVRTRRGGFLPAVRLLNPLLWPRVALAGPRYVASHLFAIDRGAIPEDFVFLSIEKFHHARALDLADASQCNTLYLTSEGYVPTCLYNFRRRRRCPPSAAGGLA